MVSSYREGTFRPYSEPDIGGLPGIEFRTRYFSRGKSSAIPDVPITPNVDPHGVLGDYVKGRGLQYTADNVVGFRQRKEEHDGDDM